MIDIAWRNVYRNRPHKIPTSSTNHGINSRDSYAIAVLNAHRHHHRHAHRQVSTLAPFTPTSTTLACMAVGTTAASEQSGSVPHNPNPPNAIAMAGNLEQIVDLSSLGSNNNVAVSVESAQHPVQVIKTFFQCPMVPEFSPITKRQQSAENGTPFSSFFRRTSRRDVFGELDEANNRFEEHVLPATSDSNLTIGLNTADIPIAMKPKREKPKPENPFPRKAGKKKATTANAIAVTTTPTFPFAAAPGVAAATNRAVADADRTGLATQLRSLGVNNSDPTVQTMQFLVRKSVTPHIFSMEGENSPIGMYTKADAGEAKAEEAKVPDADTPSVEKMTKEAKSRDADTPFTEKATKEDKVRDADTPSVEKMTKEAKARDADIPFTEKATKEDKLLEANICFAEKAKKTSPNVETETKVVANAEQTELAVEREEGDNDGSDIDGSDHDSDNDHGIITVIIVFIMVAAIPNMITAIANVIAAIGSMIAAIANKAVSGEYFQ